MRAFFWVVAIWLVGCSGATVASGCPENDAGALEDAATGRDAGRGSVDAGAAGDASREAATFDAGDGGAEPDAGDVCASDRFADVLCYGTSMPEAGAGYSGSCAQPRPDCVLLTDIANPSVWCCP